VSPIDFGSVVTGIVVPLLAAVCVVKLRSKDPFAGRRWLLSFLVLSIVIYCSGFLLVLGLPASLVSAEFISFYFAYPNRLLGLASAVALLAFAFAYTVRSTGEAPGAMPPRPVLRIAPRPLMPPLWLTVPTVIAVALCLENFFNGLTLRALVTYLGEPASGSGTTLEAARQFEIMGTLENVVGMLYGVAVVLCLTVFLTIILSILRNRRDADVEPKSS